MQMSFFNLDDPLLEEIKEEILNLDINTVTHGGVDETE
jgi:DNA mismatch repair protein MutS